MPDSVYNVIELVGTSRESWEKAAKAAVDMAAKTQGISGSRRSWSRICNSRMGKWKHIERK